MKTLIALSLTVLSTLSAQAETLACPDLAGTYCCGASLGDVQNCNTWKRVEQKPIEGGMKYSLKDNFGRSSVWIADSKARAVSDSFIKGTETTSCQGTYITTDVPDATLTKRPEAKGYYRASLYVKQDSGELAAFQSCVFTVNGRQVLNCGMQSGYGCYRK